MNENKQPNEADAHATDKVAKTNSPKKGFTSLLHKKPVMVGGGIFIIAVLAVAGWLIFGSKDTNQNGFSGKGTNTEQSVSEFGDPDSLDPVQKGLASTNGKCDGQGSTKMTYAPMAAKDIGTIAPMGGFGGSHVTPIDHEYYYQADLSKPKDSYAVIAVMDGNLNSVGYAEDATKTAWNITLSHSCTFMVMYNLMTSLAPDVKSQMPANWKEMGGAIKIPVKAGQVIGYVGGQSLDFQVADTTFTNPKLLYHTAYNNREPFKINTVHALDYFADSVKAQILPFYLRASEPRDGNYAYDVDGQAVGTWFKTGTNGYAGGNKADGTTNETAGHLALAYDSFDPTLLELSIGEYKNGIPGVFAVKGATDWTKITPQSGIAKVELAETALTAADGTKWSGQLTKSIKATAGPTHATALIQLTAKQEMKFEIFPDKTPSEVTGFTSAAVTYDRGQNATMVKSTTAPGR